MSMTRPPYPSEFREQMVELVRSGRSPEKLAREFEPSAQSIRNWVGHAGGAGGDSYGRQIPDAGHHGLGTSIPNALLKRPREEAP